MPDPRAWMLDDGPLDLLIRHGQLPGTGLPRGLFHLAESVRNATREPIVTQWAACGALQVHPVLYGSEASACYQSWRVGARSDANRGEHEAVALLATELPAPVFVAGDKLACWLALAELGGARVASPYELWDALRADGLLERAAWDTLAEHTRRKNQELPRPWRHRR